MLSRYGRLSASSRLRGISVRAVPKAAGTKVTRRFFQTLCASVATGYDVLCDAASAGSQIERESSMYRMDWPAPYSHVSDALCGAFRLHGSLKRGRLCGYWHRYAVLSLPIQSIAWTGGRPRLSHALVLLASCRRRMRPSSAASVAIKLIHNI